MALKAGYQGVKKSFLDLINSMKIITSIGDGLALSEGKELSVNEGNGLHFDANDKLELDLGDGLEFDANGKVKTSGAGLPDYSTTEFDTGRKWIDGKEIYGKVLVPSSGSITKNTWVDLGVMGIGTDTVSDAITIKGMIKNATGNAMYPFPDSTVTFKYEKDVDKVFIYCTEDWDNRPVFIIMEYTKVAAPSKSRSKKSTQ